MTVPLRCGIVAVLVPHNLGDRSMNWDPSLLTPSHLALWQIALAWAIQLPLTFLFFLMLTTSGIMSIDMTEAMLKEEVAAARPIKRFFLTVFVGPTLAVIGSALLFLFMTAAICGAASNRRD
ncbi:MAG: hypothetical protein UT69_C0003G0011 [Candidatus Yanofskybacteria bacterium GW2011_GWE1_40_10]|nr:MAG: hypothetical protein UT69_C0003G0011 [Candidatus Yanofskybacteria bacterium GW2011_GWE1_40_10]